MARLFTAGADYLKTIITAYDSGPWTYFAWVRRDGAGGGSFGRVFHVDPTGTTATDGQAIAEGVVGSGQPSTTAKQPFATISMENGADLIWSSSWRFFVFTYDGSTSNPDDSGGTTNTQCAIFWGDISTSMTQVDSYIVDSPPHVGSGARTTGLTDLYVGNRGTLNRGWNGAIFCVGMVPYMMSATDAETLRTGNLTPLVTNTAPIFFFGLQGSDLNSYSGIGPSLTLSLSGTVNTDTDPQTLFLPSGSPTPVVTFRNKITVVTEQW